MHVGLNLIYLVPRQTGGMEIVARELIPALVRERPDWRFTSFVNRETAEEPGPWCDDTERVVVPVDAVNRLAWVRGEQQLLPGLCRRAGVEVLHSLGATTPLWGGGRRVVTIYDFNYLLFADSHSSLRARGLDLLVRSGTRRAHRVITCSHSTARDAERFLGLSAADIDVVPLGLGALPDETPTPAAQLRQRLDLGERPVLFTLSDRRPHKNLLALVEALAALPAPRPVLVVAGYSTPHEHEVRARIAELGLHGDVRMLEWISAADREGLYALATAFAFPSLYEGFGLPVLEAMARGVPVVCSDAASLPEVAGDAAITFSPRDVPALTRALRTVLGDAERREDLARRGRARAAEFTWQRTARSHAEVYERVVA